MNHSAALSLSCPRQAMHRVALFVLVASLLAPLDALAHDPDFTEDFDRDRCTFATTGSNPFFPLWPGYALHIVGEEEDDGELVEISSWITVLTETELVDGVQTRVFEERETEDGELIEISRNFVALCRETGDVWYFGEDVDIYEDGEIIRHDGAWRAGIDGAAPGILMPGSPLVGGRYFEEIAPGVALDRAEVVSVDEMITVPLGTYENVLRTAGGSALDPSSSDDKYYAPGVGVIKDDVLELVEIVPPPCQPDATTLCLNDGRFRVEVDWEKPNGEDGPGMAILPSDDSGEFWFFSPNNTEMIVKVIDACVAPFNHFWVFAAGLTNVEVSITVTDTKNGLFKEYENPLGQPFAPIQDTSAFDTCP